MTEQYTVHEPVHDTMIQCRVDLQNVGPKSGQDPQTGRLVLKV